MLCRMARPTVARRRLAPTTATDRGPQQRAQARHIRPAFPARHGLQVMAQPVIVVAAGQGEGQLDRVPGDPPPGGQAGVGEYPQHRRVLRQRLRGERRQAALPRLPDQVLQQHAGDPAAVHVIGDGERHLRHAGLPGQLISADAGQPAVLPGQQRRMVGIGLAADPPGFLLGRARAHAEEPQVHVVRRHGRVHRADRLKVLRPGRPDLHRAAVGQQRIRARRWRAHRPVPSAGGTTTTGHRQYSAAVAAHRSVHQVLHRLTVLLSHDENAAPLPSRSRPIGNNRTVIDGSGPSIGSVSPAAR